MSSELMSNRSVMVVRFGTDSGREATLDSIVTDGGTPTLTCTDCESSGRVSSRQAATANGDIDGIRRDVKCDDCAGAAERRADVTT
ncbi:hypothetical protein ACFO0N_14845 [Halobium salinum]|uniref:Uncharacterized protein n=1 Tax=Halobium salinum TaxID=1364940 RepID=A0ABD5PEN5_9EURY|nr:hypothetical protein [Halobium salinum]